MKKLINIFLIIIIFGFTFINQKVYSQCIIAENGDKISVKIILDTANFELDTIISKFMNCESNLDVESKLFTSLKLENQQKAKLCMYNLTYDTIYYYSIEKKFVNWKITSYNETFGRIILDSQEITFSERSGCSNFHIKFYNPKTDEDDDNILWIKVWKE